MGGGDDELVGDQRAAAEEQPVQRYGRLPRVLADLRVGAADDPPVVAARPAEAAAAAAVSRPTAVRSRRPRAADRPRSPRDAAGAVARRTGASMPLLPPSPGRVVVAAAGSGRRRQVRRRWIAAAEVVGVVVLRRMSDGRQPAVGRF